MKIIKMVEKIAIYFLFLALLIFTLPVSLNAQTPFFNTENLTSAFSQKQEITDLRLTIPTVVQLSVSSNLPNTYAVLEIETYNFQPFALVSFPNETQYSFIRINDVEISDDALDDENYSTYKEFSANSSVENSVELHFEFEKPITTSRFAFSLDNNVQMPQYISIRSSGTTPKVVLNKKYISSSIVNFPLTTSNSFTVTLYYTQLLRISEAKFEEIPVNNSIFLRFLAKPNHTYRLYSGNSGSGIGLPVSEAGNLADKNILILDIEAPTIEANENYLLPDRDGDIVTDQHDNCQSVANPDQVDTNQNNLGDACEDFDVDGIINSQDNCPNDPNRLQQDKDSDGLGDHCDSEESRIFERLWFLPWMGIALGFTVVVLLFKATLKRTKD